MARLALLSLTIEESIAIKQAFRVVYCPDGFLNPVCGKDRLAKAWGFTRQLICGSVNC